MENGIQAKNDASPPIVFTKIEKIETGVQFSIIKLSPTPHILSESWEALYNIQCQCVAQVGLELMIFLAWSTGWK